ncbi:hypothetical protein [Salinimicrobium sp. GXAS 041]|uniref:hypothetical protein n=1 Tax=Salinimicrobium sp. GXAS 041 TaxID=3400806 RepID=UPI003C721327
MRKNFICLVLLVVFTSCNNKTGNQKIDFQPVLDSIENDFQKNLDTGVGMLQTSRNYRLVSDSLLNVIYDRTQELENIRLDSLRRSQEKFLSNRKKTEDSLWKEVEAISAKQGISPELDRMLAYGHVGNMNIERAYELNKILKNHSQKYKAAPNHVLMQ